MDKSVNPLRVAYHTLRISDPEASLAFYQEKLGLSLHGHANSTVDATRIQHYFLGFAHPDVDPEINHWDRGHQTTTLLELIYRADQPTIDNASHGTEKVGYWKIGITLADVDLARQNLIEVDTIVSEPKQFHDVGYLCHLSDPDGYTIELLQHRFADNHQPSLPLANYRLGCVATFGQITLRVKDPEKSLDFYIRGLGMQLLSRQVIEAHRFTLYFLACTEERPPYADVDDVRNREWLWQRPYTVLELQHIWGTELSEFQYRVAPTTGFEGVSFIAGDANAVVASLIATRSSLARTEALDPVSNARAITVHDPDGYAVRVIESTSTVESDRDRDGT